MPDATVKSTLWYVHSVPIFGKSLYLELGYLTSPSPRMSIWKSAALLALAYQESRYVVPGVTGKDLVSTWMLQASCAYPEELSIFSDSEPPWAVSSVTRT